MTTALIALDVPEFQSLSPSKAEQIRNTFLPMAETLAEFEVAFTDVTQRAANGITKEISADARRVRLDIAKIRIAAEKARVEIKAEYVLGGKAIDGANNILKWAIEGKERALEAIEKHAEREEALRLDALMQERTQVLAALGVVAPAGVATMDSDVWNVYLRTKQADHADRLEAERVAAAERAEQEHRRAVALERTREIAKVYDFVPADVREDPTSLSDDVFADVMALASAAALARQLELDNERIRAAEAARDVARLEAERAEVQARADAEARAELARAAESDRIAREQAQAPVKARLRDWVASFALPALPGDAHPTEAAIRKSFEAFRASALRSVEKLGEVES